MSTILREKQWWHMGKLQSNIAKIVESEAKQAVVLHHPMTIASLPLNQSLIIQIRNVTIVGKLGTSKRIARCYTGNKKLPV